MEHIRLFFPKIGIMLKGRELVPLDFDKLTLSIEDEPKTYLLQDEFKYLFPLFP